MSGSRHMLPIPQERRCPLENLMIRGDRLALLCKVLQFLYCLYGPRTLPLPPRSFSLDRVLAVLGEKAGVQCADLVRGWAKGEEAAFFFGLELLIDILEASGERVATVEFAAIPLCVLDPEDLLVPFYAGVASGEITEEMLKEPTAATT